MKVLVIGGSGFIGKNIVDNLIEKKYDVTVFDLVHPHDQRIHFIQGTMCSKTDLLPAMTDIDYVIHCAGQADINKAVIEPFTTITLNILGTARVLEAARQSDIQRILFASSYFVNSGGGHIYSTTKLASEMLLKDYYHLYNLPYTILRYGTVYGPRSRGDDVISIFVKNALSDRPLIIHGDGSQTRNFIYCDDIAEGTVAALHEKAINKTFYLEGKESISIKKVALTIKELIRDVKIEYSEARIVDFCGKTVSLQEIKKDLGWEPRIDFREGVKRYIRWYIRQVNHSEQKLAF